MEINVVKKIKILGIIAASFLTNSCANNTYSDITAYLQIDNVSSSPILATACTSLGEFCTVRLSGGSIILIEKNGQTADQLTFTAVMRRNTAWGLGVGFIIGLPSTPEQLEETSKVVCFDLACPNCYVESNYAISKKMNLDNTNNFVSCSRCNRTYDLNNLGIVSSGDAGRALLRYNVVYYPNSRALTISNR